jgi:hypothetical protein
LHEQFRHIDAERGAGDLQFGVEIGTLRRRHFDGAGSEDDANRDSPVTASSFLQRRVDARNGAQRARARRSAGWMYWSLSSARISCGARLRVASDSGRSVPRRHRPEPGCVGRSSGNGLRGGCY